MISGAADRTRTYDPIITNDVLYHLSYSGAWLAYGMKTTPYQEPLKRLHYFQGILSLARSSHQEA